MISCHDRTSLGEMQLLFCRRHKAEGMVSLRRTGCIKEGCPKVATYNIAGALLYGHYRLSNRARANKLNQDAERQKNAVRAASFFFSSLSL